MLATDAFPPVCGGSGWSTYELARGLRARGDDVIVLHVKPGAPSGVRERAYDDLRVIEFGFAAPGLPYVRNYLKNERLWPALAAEIARIIDRERIDIVHGQHVMTSLPAIAGAHARRIPAVSTVRDYWPVCYWSDLIHTRDSLTLCPGCSAQMMTVCIRPRAGSLWPLALPLIPYMRGNLARKRSGLAAADAVIAVSSTIAADLRARAPELSATRIDVIPNPVDVQGLRRRASTMTPPLDGPYALYLGKLAPNKGTAHLVDIAEGAALDFPLVIVGDGPDRAALEAAAARSARDIRFIGWVDQNETARWLRHAALLVFTSRGPESLSRVLIEASALGVPIAAMSTGGTPDIVTHDVTGLLSTSPAALAADVRRLRENEPLRRRLGAAARAHAEARFDGPSVVARIADLYRRVLNPTAVRSTTE
ncbi:MAG TPA: glycosyltransferase family 4 protein [Vicinamibacterales bacterium]|nr:glycosyltransferase family 4 protein [Vicinamibacterales bacterium]